MEAGCHRFPATGRALLDEGIWIVLTVIFGWAKKGFLTSNGKKIRWRLQLFNRIVAKWSNKAKVDFWKKKDYNRRKIGKTRTGKSENQSREMEK